MIAPFVFFYDDYEEIERREVLINIHDLAFKWQKNKQKSVDSTSHCQRLSFSCVKKTDYPGPPAPAVQAPSLLWLSLFTNYCSYYIIIIIITNDYSYYISTLASDPGQRHLMRLRLGSEQDITPHHDDQVITDDHHDQDITPQCLTCPKPHTNITESKCVRYDEFYGTQWRLYKLLRTYLYKVCVWYVCYQ